MRKVELHICSVGSIPEPEQLHHFCVLPVELYTNVISIMFDCR